MLQESATCGVQMEITARCPSTNHAEQGRLSPGSPALEGKASHTPSPFPATQCHHGDLEPARLVIWRDT